MFIRILRPSEGKEFLINVAHISYIEVEYGVLGSDNNYWKTSLKTALTDPDAVRSYRFVVGGESFRLVAEPGDPVLTVFETIYKDAIKT